MPSFLRKPRKHVWDRRKVYAPEGAGPVGPTVDVTRVAVQGGYEFDWTIYWEFSDDLPTDLTIAGLVGLKVDSVGPAYVEDADANWLVLRYHSDQGVGAGWVVLPGGSPVFAVGEAGVVGEM